MSKKLQKSNQPRSSDNDRGRFGSEKEFDRADMKGAIHKAAACIV